MKIVLINPPIKYLEMRQKLKPIISNLFYNSPPLGLCYLAGVLEKKGVFVKIIDAAVEDLDFSAIIKRIRSFKADLIGITSLTNAFHVTVELAKTIKKELRLPIVIGGPHVTANPNKVLLLKCFDIGILGEGEITLVEVIDALEKKKDLREIDGIAFCHNSEIFFTKPREYIKNLDMLPFPARHLVPLELYIPQPNDERQRPKLSMITSRGCPYRCIFCDKSIFGQGYRTFSPEYIVSEMEYLSNNFGAKDIAFVDSMLGIDTKKIEKLTSAIQKKGLHKKVSWTCTIRANTINKQLLRKMKETGCWRVRIGIETGSEEVLKFIKKDITKNQIKDAVFWANELRLQPKAFFILGHLIDTKETIEETIDFAKSLPLKDITVQLNTPLPDTYQYKIYKDYGILVDSSLSRFSFWEPVFLPHGLRQGYLAKMQKKFYRAFYLRPVIIWRHLREIRSLYDIKKYLKAIRLLIYLFKEDI